MSDLPEKRPAYEPGPTRKYRDEVIEQLSSNYSRGNLELEEFEHRVRLAEEAETRGELVALIRDLPRLPSSAADGAAPAARRDVSYSLNRGEVRNEQHMIAIFSDSKRRGVWDPARRISSLSLFGSTKLDFRQARLSPGLTEVKLAAVFGECIIHVPQDINVEVNGFGLFGEFEDTSIRSDIPGSPTLRIEGLALFGSVKVKVDR